MDKDSHRSQPAPDRQEEYEPPQIEELDAGQQPAVTAAGANTAVNVSAPRRL